jgi:hypothetical protein
LEKHHYLTGIEQALGGLEKAHVVLAAATRRMEVQIAGAGRSMGTHEDVRPAS